MATVVRASLYMHITTGTDYPIVKVPSQYHVASLRATRSESANNFLCKDPTGGVIQTRSPHSTTDTDLKVGQLCVHSPHCTYCLSRVL